MLSYYLHFSKILLYLPMIAFLVTTSVPCSTLDPQKIDPSSLNLKYCLGLNLLFDKKYFQGSHW